MLYEERYVAADYWRVIEINRIRYKAADFIVVMEVRDRDLQMILGFWEATNVFGQMD